MAVLLLGVVAFPLGPILVDDLTDSQIADTRLECGTPDRFTQRIVRRPCGQRHGGTPTLSLLGFNNLKPGSRERSPSRCAGRRRHHAHPAAICDGRVHGLVEAID